MGQPSASPGEQDEEQPLAAGAHPGGGPPIPLHHGGELLSCSDVPPASAAR